MIGEIPKKLVNFLEKARKISWYILIFFPSTIIGINYAVEKNKEKYIYLTHELLKSKDLYREGNADKSLDVLIKLSEDKRILNTPLEEALQISFLDLILSKKVIAEDKKEIIKGKINQYLQKEESIIPHYLVSSSTLRDSLKLKQFLYVLAHEGEVKAEEFFKKNFLSNSLKCSNMFHILVGTDKDFLYRMSVKERIDPSLFRLLEEKKNK